MVCVSRKPLALWCSRTMASAGTLLIAALVLCTRAQDVVSSATSGGGGSNRNRNTKGRTQLVSVSAPWPTSSLSSLAEASEFVAEGGGGLFWDFVEALGDAPHSVFCPPSACASHGDSAGEGAATAEEGSSRHIYDSLRESAAAAVADALQPPQQQVFVPPDDEEVEAAAAAARLAADAAVTAAGLGFRGGAGGGIPGVGLDALSLRLLEVALSARCVWYPIVSVTGNTGLRRHV